MTKVALRLTLLLGVMVSIAFAADFWTTKDFLQWGDKEVKKMLNNSPWARTVVVSMGGGGMGRGGGGGGGGTQTPGSYGGRGMGGPGGGGGMQRQFVVRWISALPVKQALMKAQYGEEAATAEESQLFLSRQDTHYVIGVSGFPGRMAQMSQRDPDRFKQSAFLKRKKKDNIYPEQFDIRGNEQEAEIIFAFPRGDEITLDDKNVELEVKLGQMTVKRKFKLQDMVWDGKLEL